MKKLLFVLFTIISFWLVSCERKIDFNLEEKPDRLVVEATIENDQPPLVILTKSLNYFNKISPDILANSFITDAEVYVSNGTLTHRLKLYNIPLGSGFSLYYYSTDSSDLATSFNGELNKEYSLRIVWMGENYTAETRIPLITRRIDSLFWKPPPGNNFPDKAALMIRATDPPGFGDYIRYFTRQNNNPFYPPTNSVYDDQVIDGTTYEIEVERGVDRNQDLPDGYTFFDRGDTVVLKLCNIDKQTFDFWRTMEYSYSSIGNPFSLPAKVLSNISNGALGYFGGYAAQYKTLVIPK